MIRLGLRLTIAGGRETVVRLAMIAAAVAIGVALLLVCLAGTNGVNTQNARYAWLNTGTGSATLATGDQAANAPLWWRIRADMYQGKIIGRVDVAATRTGAPVPPGIPSLPGPGEYYASPAMAALLRSTPSAQLGVRFPGRQVGTIGDSALPAPDTLLIIMGDSPAHLARQPGARPVTAIETTTPSKCNGEYCSVAVGISGNGFDLIMSVVAVGLLVPLLIFIATATRLSAARREERFAAMRLVGGTPRQISIIAAVESVLAATVGMVAGFGLFAAVRPAAAGYPFTGVRFFLGDLTLTPPDVLIVALGVPAGAAVAALVALRRVQVSPLGVTRRVTPKPPRAWRLIPLLAGIAELSIVVAVGAPQTSVDQIAAYTPGFVLLLIGLVIAGPWLTMNGARAMARRARRPAALIAARRLADDPRAGFRTISGLILALFVSTVAVAVMGSIAANREPPGGPVSHEVLFGRYAYRAPDAVPLLPRSTASEIGAIPGVRVVLQVHASPTGERLHIGRYIEEAGLVSCADLARVPSLGRCPAGAEVAAMPAGGFAWGDRAGPPDTTTWPAASESADRLAALPVLTIAVGTDGSAPALERSRSLLEAAYPDQAGVPETITEMFSHTDTSQFQQLANVMILASLVVAGCTLAVSVAGGLSERRRPFSLLRLTGVPLRMLRRVVALESAVPLLAVALVAIATAYGASELFLRAQLGYTVEPPGAAYYLSVAAGLLGSLAIIAGTLPLLKRITGPETARNE